MINSNKGQSLIEIVVAVGIIALVLVGVSDLITRSLSLASYQTKKNQAINIAQDQLNHFRKFKDQEPLIFFEKPSDYNVCEPGFDTTKYTCAITYSNEVYEGGVIVGIDMKVSVGWIDGNNNIMTELSQTLAKPRK